MIVPIVVMPADQISQHDREVLTKINGYINRSFRRSFTLSENLDAAQAQAEGARQGPHDLTGRDAEYYLKCRLHVSQQDHLLTAIAVGAGGTALNVFYNGIKLALIGAGAEELIQTDKDVMVTPPGGITWGAKGCYDGLSDEGDKVTKPKPARIEPAPSLTVPVGSMQPQFA